MSTHVHLRKYEVEDFVSFDHGTGEVTMTIFNGKVHVGTPGWANECRMTPDQADAVADELKRRAQAIRSNDKVEFSERSEASER